MFQFAAETENGHAACSIWICVYGRKFRKCVHLKKGKSSREYLPVSFRVHIGIIFTKSGSLMYTVS